MRRAFAGIRRLLALALGYTAASLSVSLWFSEARDLIISSAAVFGLPGWLAFKAWLHHEAPARRGLGGRAEFRRTGLRALIGAGNAVVACLLLGVLNGFHPILLAMEAVAGLVVWVVETLARASFGPAAPAVRAPRHSPIHQVGPA